MSRQGLADKDFLFSVNNQEGNIVLNTLGRFQNVTVANAIDNDFFGTLLDFALLTRLGVAEDEVVSEMVNFTYTYPRDASGRRTLTSLMHLYADISFIVPVVEFARAVSSVTTAGRSECYRLSACCLELFVFGVVQVIFLVRKGVNELVSE